MSARRGTPGDLGLAPLDGGARCALTVRAQPGARRAGFAGTWNGIPRIAVAAPPEDGRANAALAATIAELFGLRPSAVRLVAGATAREKRFELDAPEAAARARLTALASEASGHDDRSSAGPLEGRP
ncbi:MAG: DUF167 domain-containing protein [Planctomycetes bacterium]|nr:DUF167 domain-containing protein [Planctomycetota bacterium]